jgi:hypothetical protein
MLIVGRRREGCQRKPAARRLVGGGI